MPTYTFTLPVAARASVITLTNEVTGATVDTIGIGASTGTVSTVAPSGAEVVISSSLDVGEYRADASSGQTWRLTEYSAEGVLDVPASLQALPDTIGAAIEPVTVGSLRRWYQRLAEDATTAKIAFIGDSTTGGATDLFTVLRTYYTARGQSLAGMQSANIIQGGNNGYSLAAWLANAVGANDAPYSLASLAADDPDLIVAGWGLNDARLGATTLAQMIARLTEFVEMVSAQHPDADILLRMPNSLTTTVVGTDYVDGITHQAASDLLRQAHLNLSGVWPHVVVADVQAEVFGTTALPLSVLMYDELHPSVAGYRATAHYLGTKLLGPTADRVAIGPQASYRFQRDGYILAAGSGYFDIAALPGRTDLPHPREWPLTTSDIVVINGYGTFSLSGATFGTTGNTLRILKTGDWTSLIGAQVQVSGSHADLGATEGRYFATIDPGSVAAGAYLDVTYTLTGVTREMGLVIQPPSTLWATGLILTYGISADNTVTLRFYNPTGSAIDLATNTGWRIWVLR